MSDEIRSAFHEQLDEVRTGVARLSAGVTELIPRSTQALLDADLEAADYIIQGDTEYDEKSLQLEEECFNMIALQQPVASDLRLLISSVKIIADVERSADLCVNICKAARRLYSHELDAPLRGMINKLGAQATREFKEATEAYLQNDGPRAAAVADMDDYMDDLHRQFIQSIFQSHAADGIDLQVGVQLALIARFYERIGDHAVNVAERTRYIATGWVPEEPYAESGTNFETIDVAGEPADQGG